MNSIIVVPMGSSCPDDQISLAPGETLSFGRGDRTSLTIPHEGVSREAGEITAVEAHWALSNLSRGQTYVVENPEGAGEHVKVAPGRLAAPIPFEFSRVVLPAGSELLSFDVWAPRHDYLDRPGSRPFGAPTASAFPLDHGKRYFQVLVALCAARLRGEPHAPLPTADELAELLRPNWPTVSRTSVQWNIDYLTVKLRLKPGPEATESGPRLNGRKEQLVSLALRFDLVREDHLELLGGSAVR